MKGFKGEKPDERSKAAQEIVEIVKKAKMRIVPDGLNELMGVVEKGMKEPNKATLKENIMMNGVLAEALGPAAKTYMKKCMVPLCKLLSDKQNLVRQKVVESLNKWGESIGNENVITWCII